MTYYRSNITGELREESELDNCQCEEDFSCDQCDEWEEVTE